MRTIKIASLLTVAVAITGCASLTPKDLATPSEVTLEQALTSVGQGLYEMKEAQKGMKTGLIASSVDVRFKLAASSKDSGKLTIDLSNTLAPGSGSKSQFIGGEKSAESSAARSNEITVKFVNILTIPANTLAYEKTADELAKIILLPDSGGWTIFGTGIEQEDLLNEIRPEKEQAGAK